MARIRTIKPDFFRHEGLQDLEIANPGMYPMMVFEGLWGHCDSKGRFEWRPRQLKLDILPFLPFDMAETLLILEQSGMVNHYTIDGKEYGEISTFEKHQRLSGKELTEGEKFPPCNSEAIVKQQGSVREIPESQEGKGREGNGVNPAPKKPARFDPMAIDLPDCIPEDAWGRWITYRRQRKLSTTEQTAFAQIEKLVAWRGKGHSPPKIIDESIANGWQGLFEPKVGGTNNASNRESVIAAFTGSGQRQPAILEGYSERLVGSG